MKKLMLIVVAFSLFGCGGGGGGGSSSSSNTPSVSLSQLSGTQYVVTGNNMDGVAAIDLTINYDSSTLSSPVVTDGAFVSGAIVGANTNNAGIISMGIIRATAFSGSGQIATISFTVSSGTVPGNVSLTSTKLYDVNGSSI